MWGLLKKIKSEFTGGFLDFIKSVLRYVFEKIKIFYSQDRYFVNRDERCLPLFRKTWFIVSLSLLFPLFGIPLLIFIGNMNRKAKTVVISMVAFFWLFPIIMMFFSLFIGGIGSFMESFEDPVPETTYSYIDTTTPEATEHIHTTTTAPEETTTTAYTTTEQTTTTETTTTTQETTTTETTATSEPFVYIEPEEPQTFTQVVLHDYAVNTETYKFHSPGCRTIPSDADSHWVTYYSTSSEAMKNMGYSPCGVCRP